MRISETFGLQKTQWELDFVDINPDTDLPLFLDPNFIANSSGEWAENAHSTVHSFFSYVIALLQGDEEEEARSMFAHLPEPNETCLGLSVGRPRGRGVGNASATDILEQIIKSKAITSGLVQDLQDCLIFVEDFGPDGLSDMTTNIIRKCLIEYTQDQCRLWGIPLQAGVPSGYFWNPMHTQWKTEFTEMLVLEGKRILLVPKGIVSYCKTFTSEKFHSQAVLTFLQKDHLRRNTSLVRVRHDKKGREVSREAPYKKTLIETEAPLSKEFLRKFTLKHPDVFKDFKKLHKAPSHALSSEEIASASGSPVEDLRCICEHIDRKLTETPPGREAASAYHRLIVGALDLLLYPHVTQPKVEQEINEGRKRVDIVFQNSARSGIFHEFTDVQKIHCRFIWVECKNYKDDIGNEELDQLAGRLALRRGNVGLLLCREIDNEPLLLKRCRDFWRDEEKLIICITDTDVRGLLAERSMGDESAVDIFIRAKYRQIAMT